MFNTPPGPTLLGFDVILIGTILVFITAMAVMFAIYAAVTVRDPMAKRVKALNERREQLKAGIVTSNAKKRASLVRKNETTDRMKDTLQKLRVLQDSQVSVIQQKLAQAGIRQKEWAVAIIFARMVLPVVLGAVAASLVYWSNTFPEWGFFKRFMMFAAGIGLGYKGPDIFVQNLATPRHISHRLAEVISPRSASFLKHDRTPRSVLRDRAAAFGRGGRCSGFRNLRPCKRRRNCQRHTK